MEINQGLYPHYLLASLILGFLLGLVYDVFRTLRVMRREIVPERVDSAIVFVEDLLFSVICAVCVSLLSYAMNRGRIRWFSLLAMAAGFGLYRKTLSRAVMMFALWLRRLCSAAYRATLGKWLALMGRFIWKKRRIRLTKRVQSRLIKKIRSEQ